MAVVQVQQNHAEQVLN